MPVFTFARPPQSVRQNDEPTDCWLLVAYFVIDPDNNTAGDGGVEVLVDSGDNAQTIETKIRDAIVANALNSFNIVVDTANFFMNSLRRS